MATRSFLLRGTAAAGLLLWALPAAAQTAPAGASEPLRLDSISVTANKRPQRLAEVDGAVAVRTAEDLEQAHVAKVEDLERVFPGLLIRSRGNGAYANVTVRGVSSPDYYNPAVQVYVDGVAQDQAYFTQELVDVERVELLRGPQGTLYGRGAHGGVLNIVTRKPDDRPVAATSGTLSNQDRTVEAIAGLALVPGMLYGDVAVHLRDRLGSIDDTGGLGSDIDDGTTWVGRARLRYAPVGGPLDVMATAQRERLRSHEELYVKESSLKDRTVDSVTEGGLPLLDRTVNSFGLTGSYDFGGAVLTSVTSLQKRTMTRRIFGSDTPEDQRTVSEELRLAWGGSGPLSGVIGGFVQDTDFTRREPGYPGYMGASVNDVDSRSYAAFGEITYKVTPTVDVTGGLRWSREESSIDYRRGAPGGYGFSADASFGNVSPKLAFGWQVTPDHRLYALVSRGFKPGGFNHTVSSVADAVAYKSETSTNIEAGWRGALLPGILEGGAAVYWIRSNDKQIYVGPVGMQVLRNAGEAESKGIELDLRTTPLDGLTLDAGATVGRSEFTDSRDPQTGVSYDGKRVPYAPDTTLRLSARYVIPQTGIPGELSLRGGGRYYSRTYFDEANSLQQAGYTLFDASVDLALDNGMSLSVFGDNLTDKVYRTSSFRFGAGDVRSTVGQGRLIGVSGRYRF
ncbi:TonB-dependent receptor (plasmid) [Azospirillum humicireducens]|uniref:TonB-dependent receptor n=1 Tax=Azospirillum humicireducens TaxID=1226968 RepID=A0A2R4VRZ1_9PROT|nr:TonB-dependent receptor [Azospirillum humicireducens]AWB07187.1 TonB-dependent receptor [Azospirillum humicireducens]